MGIFKNTGIYKGPGIYKIGSSGGGGGGEYYEGAVIGGTTYKVKKIGNLVWTLQNLNIKDVNIPLGVSGVPTTPACWYYGDNQYINEQNGLLYNGYAVDYIVNNPTIIQGWHIPTYEEWYDLINFLGGSSVAGKKLKSINGWNYPRGTDEVGFCALPSGFRTDSGGYVSFGDQTRFWATLGNSFIIEGFWDDIQYSSRPKVYGHSIRLVKDY